MTPGDAAFINAFWWLFLSNEFLKFSKSLFNESLSLIFNALVQHGLLYVGVPPLLAIFSLYSGKSSKSAGALLSLSPEKPSILSFI